MEFLAAFLIGLCIGTTLGVFFILIPWVIKRKRMRR